MKVIRIIALTVLVVLTFPPSHSAPRTSPVVSCEEDEPCWDCTTMGNLICGSD